MWNGNSGNNGKWRCCRFGDITCKTDFRYRHHHHHKPGELLQQLLHHLNLHPLLATWILAEDVPCLLEAVQAYSPNIPSLVMITIIMMMMIKLNAVMMENLSQGLTISCCCWWWWRWRWWWWRRWWWWWCLMMAMINHCVRQVAHDLTILAELSVCWSHKCGSNGFFGDGNGVTRKVAANTH